MLNEENKKMDGGEEEQSLSPTSSLEQTVDNPPEKKKIFNENKKRLLFYTLMIALPFVQYMIFGVYVYFETLILAFQRYAPSVSGGYEVTFAGLQNFKDAWAFFADSGEMIVNSLYLFVGNLIIVLGLALWFSYYVAKRFMFSKFFRVALYLPHVVSAVVLVALYKYVTTSVFVEVAKSFVSEERLAELNLDYGLLGNNAPSNVKFFTVLFYNIWIGFGTNVMIFSGSMSSIDQSILESAQLDGVNIFQEFLHIYIPMIWPTFITFLITSMAAIFTNSMNLTVFYDTSGVSPFKVFGYYLYTATLNGDYIVGSKGATYSFLAALGAIVSAIVIPITLGVRKLLFKFGPSVD